MTDTIPTLAHAVRIGSDLSLYRERERAEMALQTKPTPGCSYGGAAGCAGACKSWCGGAA